MTPTLIYVAMFFLGACGVAAALRAIALEGQRRRSEERARVLREHPELAEIAASTWGS